MMKTRWKILVVVVVVGIIGFGMLAFMNRPLSEEAVREEIQKHLEKLVDENDTLSSEAVGTVPTASPLPHESMLRLLL